MRKILFITIITFAFITLLYGSVPDKIINLFYTGNNLYEQGKYKEAAEKYEEILKEGYASGPLYYNLGNCCFKLGLLGKTILYYERSKRLIPQDPELNFNYNYVYSLLEDKLQTPRRNWLRKKTDHIIHFLSLGKWIALTAAVWLILIISSILAVFFIRFRKVFRYIGITSAIFLLLGFINIFVLYTESTSPQAIILSKNVSARYGPGEGEVEAFLLHEGTKVTIKSRRDNWIQIQLPDGKSGWLPLNTIEEI